jgi:N-acetyl-gamma-glutamyl-phosphate reductase
LYGESLPGATLVAAAGCYPTAAALALAPLVRAGIVQRDGIVVDAASGVSGAGRVPKPHTHFNTVDEDFTAYGLLDHRHTPEIEQATGAQVLFTPHLAPMNRGILATCYARPADGMPDIEATDPLRELQRFYADSPFIVVSQRSPSTKATLGSNSAHLTARYDPRTGWILAIAAIDNLTKGAAGQAVQCANLVCRLPETVGLPMTGVYP